MLEVSEAVGLLARIEELSPRNGKPKSPKGYQIRTVLLLLAIMREEGENQVFYKGLFNNWTTSSVSVNTSTLIDHGFIVAGDDERDPRGSSKRLYFAEGVREYLNELMMLD